MDNYLKIRLPYVTLTIDLKQCQIKREGKQQTIIDKQNNVEIDIGID